MSQHHPVSADSSSSSGFSSSPCSARGPLCWDSTFDRTRDIHRRKFFNYHRGNNNNWNA